METLLNPHVRNKRSTRNYSRRTLLVVRDNERPFDACDTADTDDLTLLTIYILSYVSYIIITVHLCYGGDTCAIIAACNYLNSRCNSCFATIGVRYFESE